MGSKNPNGHPETPEGVVIKTVELEATFLEATDAMRERRHDLAKRLFRRVIASEPRFPEPHLELAVISVYEGDIENAIEEVEFALEMIGAGAHWTEDLAPHELRAFAENLMGELIIRAAAEDEQVEFDDYRDRINAAIGHFETAVALVPENEDYSYNVKQYQRLLTEKKAKR